MQRAQGFAQQGNGTVWTAGHGSENVVQTSYPYATVAVYYTGTAQLAVVFGDNNTPPTALGNPFHANADGYWWFYAPDGRYDVMMSAPDLPPWTISDLQIADAHFGTGGIYSWYEDVNANGNSLWNLNRVQATCLELGGGACAMYLCIGSNCELSVLNAGGGVVGWITQQGDMNVTGNYFVNGQPVGSTWVSDQNAAGYALENVGYIHLGPAAGPDSLDMQAFMRGSFEEVFLGINMYWDGSGFQLRNPAYGGVMIPIATNTGGEGGASIEYLPPGGSGTNLTTIFNATIHNGSPYCMLSAGPNAGLDPELQAPGQWYTYAPNNTQLIFRMRGSDGVLREATLNLS